MNGKRFPLRPCTLTWLALAGLTVVTFGIGEAGIGGGRVTAILLAIALVKSHLVAGVFMGLRATRPLWRLIMGTYLLLVCGLIGLAYWYGLPTP
jgi:hypothetical protein